jgi:hypothetical protein
MAENPQETGIVQAGPTEGEMVLNLLRDFKRQLDDMKEQVSFLDIKINKETPAQLDTAFNEIKANFSAIGRALEMINTRIPQQTGVAAAAAQGQQGGPVEQIINTILKRISGEGTPAGAGTLSDFDKEILKTSKQIQLLSLRDILKKTAHQVGVEIADHVVVGP